MLNLKIFILPLFVIISITIIWLFIKPLYEETRTLDKVKRAEMESLVQQENDLQQRATRLYEESENEGGRISAIRALPLEQNSKDLVAQIENIIKKEKMTIVSLSIDDKPVTDGLEVGILGQTGKAYQTISGQVEVKGSYGQFKQLLKDIRKLERAVNISQLDIKNTSDEEEEGAIGRYGLGFDAYWQDEITAEQVKAGLESKEFASASSAGLTPTTPAIPGVPPTDFVQ